MGASPRVSIGLPVYNGERFLASTLDSLLGQDYEDLEVIVSDNASTDTTPEIALAYARKDPRVRYLRNERNVGVDANYRRVFELARGQYFKWSAHDDQCAPSFVRRCVEVLDADPGVVLCCARTARIHEDDRVEERPVPSLDVSQPTPAQRFHAVIWGLGLPYQVYGLMRAEALRRTALMPAFEGSDRLLLAEMALLGRFHEIPEVLFYYRRYRQSYFERTRRYKARAWQRRAYVYPTVLALHHVRALRRAGLGPLATARLAGSALARFAVMETAKNVGREVKAGVRGLGGPLVRPPRQRPA